MYVYANCVKKKMANQLHWHKNSLSIRQEIREKKLVLPLEERQKPTKYRTLTDVYVA